MEGFRYWDIMRWKEGKVFEQEFLGMYISAPGPIDVTGDGNPDFNIKTSHGAGTPNPDLTTLEFSLAAINADGTTNYDAEAGYLIAHPLNVVTRTWVEERDYFYPIPTRERVLTNGALKQNPGWNDGLRF